MSSRASASRPRRYFSVDDNFFYIDAEQLDTVTTRLYGYAISESGIIEQENLSGNQDKIGSCGVFVYVENDTARIVIRQDFNGSYGIYVFRQGDYFALSNSFLYLVEHLTPRFALSVNHDYARHLLYTGLNSQAYAETIYNEITILPNNAVVHVDIASKKMTVDYLDTHEYAYSLATAEGMAVLDSWFVRWTRLFRAISAKTKRLSVHLSGGFDSRCAFLVLLQSGIDRTKIHIESIDDSLHTHLEDYAIARQIATHFGCTLNTPAAGADDYLACSLDDILDMCLYGKFFFHKEMCYRYKKYTEKHYTIPGYGGEYIRGYGGCAMTPEELLLARRQAARRYAKGSADSFARAVTNITTHAVSAVRARPHHQYWQDGYLLTSVFRALECRNHFGRAAVEALFANEYMLGPLMDPALHTLALSTPECPDRDLLLAVIFTRYCPELLTFPFDSRHAIRRETIAAAVQLSAAFPPPASLFSDRYVKHDYILSTEDRSGRDTPHDQPLLPDDAPDRFLKRAVLSTHVMRVFTRLYGRHLYHHALRYAHRTDFFPLRYCYSVLAVVLAEDYLADRHAATPTRKLLARLHRYAEDSPYTPPLSERIVYSLGTARKFLLRQLAKHGACYASVKYYYRRLRKCWRGGDNA